MGDHLTIVGFERASVDMMDFPNGDSDTAWIKNSIIVDGGGSSEALYRGGGDYNNVFNNAGGNYGGSWNGSGTGGANDVSMDPNFITPGFSEEDPNRWDPSWLRYYTDSPLATAGEGNTYLGAFEPLVMPPAPLAGDVDGDGWVAGNDLSITISNWGMTGATREDGDLNGNGTVDGPDYSEVLTYWGMGIPPLEPPSGIPEAATLGLLLTGGLALLRRRLV